MRAANWFKRKWKRLFFRLGTRPVFRDRRAHFPFLPRMIWRTPHVRGKRLALKRWEEVKTITERRGITDTTRRTWNAIMDYHRSITPQSYELMAAKQFPPMRGKRVQIYYDRPSLRDLLDMKQNRRTREFLRANKMTFQEAHDQAVKVFEELDQNIYKVTQLWLKTEPDYDLNIGDQFIIDSKTNGKLRVVMVDI